jgi:hypothetical protein
MTPITKTKQFLHYLWDKKSEISELDEKDILLSKLIMDIHRTRTCHKIIQADLFAIYPVHPLNRPNSIKATEKRVAILKQVQEEFRQTKNINRETLHTHLPSVSGVKVVRTTGQTFISFEGNGRIAALQTVFLPEDHLTIEVEEYIFKKPTSILKQMNTLRDMHHLS